MKSKPRILILATLTLVLLAGVIWLAIPAREPVYQGRPLSVWLDGPHLNTRTAAQNRQAKDDAKAALHQAGSKAIPTLLGWLRAYDSPLRLRLVALAKKQPFINFSPVSAVRQHELASEGFLALGGEAADAVPDLIAIYENAPDPGSRLTAADVLSFVGPSAQAAMPALLHGAETSPSPELRKNSIRTLGWIHADTGLLLPLLLHTLHDTNDAVRLQSIRTLQQMPVDGRLADTIVPAVVKFLSDTNVAATECACLTLEAYGADARSAIPALFDYLNGNPPSAIMSSPRRAAVIEAIRIIDPKTAALRKDELDAFLRRPSKKPTP